MAKRLSVKEILEAARKGGPAKPEEAQPGDASTEEVAAASVEETEAPPEPSAQSTAAPPASTSPPPNVPTPSTLGRPLTLKEKLAAARAGGAAQPGASPSPPASASAAPPTQEPPADEDEAPAEETPAAPSVPPPAPSLGRPLTLKEKLAAARSGAAAAPAAKPAGAKPSAAKPAAAKAAAARTLPPLDKITDPKDLAEALRQSSDKKSKEAAASAATKTATAAGATPAQAAAAAKASTRDKAAKPQSVLPKPGRAGLADTSRRRFLANSVLGSWVVAGWTSFAASCGLFSMMLGRFMFPNVLAEPPSTVKVGLPSGYEPEEVNERFKAEWGFWIVRTTRYNGEDIIFALQSVCTHLGCPPNWLAGEQKFKCPCHGSGFYISGVNFEGPAPRPLERFKVTVSDDGQMVVDKSQKFQEELHQWSDPESYLTA